MQQCPKSSFVSFFALFLRFFSYQTKRKLQLKKFSFPVTNDIHEPSVILRIFSKTKSITLVSNFHKTHFFVCSNHIQTSQKFYHQTSTKMKKKSSENAMSKQVSREFIKNETLEYPIIYSLPNERRPKISKNAQLNTRSTNYN